MSCAAVRASAGWVGKNHPARISAAASSSGVISMLPINLLIMGRLTVTDEEHGTYAGLQAHKRRSEEPCQPCKDAGAAYMRKFRKERPLARESDRWFNGTRSAALERLASEYPARFRELLEEERARTPHPWLP